MNPTEKPINTTSETVLEPKQKKTRKFNWTEKRKAQFEKMMAANKAKKSKKETTSHSDKDSDKKEEVDLEPENRDITEKEEKQSKSIVKRIMDPHFLSRTDRHTLGTTSDPSSESEEGSSSDSEETSDSESSVEIKKKVLKKPKTVKVDWKLEKKISKLRAKNKQLQELFLHKSNKKQKYSPDNSDESDKETSTYTRAPVKAPPTIYFC